ncbi:MAG: hypothetical protein ABSE17_02315 [Candidatus Levyibacteriota bacterium]
MKRIYLNLKKIIAICLVLLFLIVIGSIFIKTSYNWAKLYSTDGSFSINFPSAPTKTVSEQQLKNDSRKVAITEYRSEPSKNIIFSLYFTKYPFYFDDTTKTLVGLRDETLSSNGKFKLLTSNLGKYFGLPGVKFTAINQDSTSPKYLNDLIILLGNSAYIMELDDNNNDLASFNKFYSSFSLSDIWQTYTSNEGNFRISFPTASRNMWSSDISLSATQKKHEITIDTFDAKGDQYSVQLDIYPYNLSGSQEELNSIKSHIEQALAGFTVISDKDSTFKGYRSFDLLLKKQNNFIKYRDFVVNNYAYIIISSSTNSDFPKFEDFANSFQLINTNPTIK